MTETTTAQQQMEAAASSVVAKLRAFQAGLTPDEQQVLALALHGSGADAEDVQGSMNHNPTGAPADAVMDYRRRWETDREVARVQGVLSGLGIPWTPPRY